MEQLYCAAPECDRPAVRGPWCQTHLKRYQRGKSLSDPITEKLTPEERVIEAGNQLVDAGDDDTEYEARRKSFLRACENWMRARGWTPPGRAVKATPSMPARARTSGARPRASRWMQLALFELQGARPRPGRGC